MFFWRFLISSTRSRKNLKVMKKTASSGLFPSPQVALSRERSRGNTKMYDHYRNRYSAFLTVVWQSKTRKGECFKELLGAYPLDTTRCAILCDINARPFYMIGLRIFKPIKERQNLWPHAQDRSMFYSSDCSRYSVVIDRFKLWGSVLQMILHRGAGPSIRLSEGIQSRGSSSSLIKTVET